jgi:RNA polymerase sigma factor (sigma-70 family)
MNLDPSANQRLSALLAQAQDGDRAAYEAFLRAASEVVREFVRFRLRDAADAEDVVQDVLLAVHRYRHTYDPGRPVAPWLYAIARHRVLDATKSRRRRLELEQPEGAAASGSVRLEELATASTPVEHPERQRLARALDLLSAAQREIIRLLKIEGYSVAEIAVKTGQSRAAVKVTAHRGYEHLRRALNGGLRDY